MKKQFYTVQPNDTLGGISRKTGVSISDLAKLNGIQNPNKIRAGKKLALNKEAVCGVNIQFLDKDHNPLRGLSYVVKYCGKETSAKTDQSGRGAPIETESPTDEIVIFVQRITGDLKQIATVASGYANKLVTIVSPKLKLNSVTRPHPSEKQLTPDLKNTTSKTPQKKTVKSTPFNAQLQSAWSWLTKELGIWSEESTSQTGKPVVAITKDKVTLDFLEKFSGEKLTEKDYDAAAKELGCEVDVIKTIEMVESGGSGFDRKNRPYILYERHVFSRNTIPKHKYDEIAPNLSFKTRYHWGQKKIRESVDDLPEDEYPNVGSKDKNNEFSYQRLAKAMALDSDAAMKACSWGKFQVLGENYAGDFSSVREMVEAVCESERGQLKTFISFVKLNKLQKSMNDKDWLHIARIYNGKSQKGYDVKLKAQYEKLTASNVEKN